MTDEEHDKDNVENQGDCESAPGSHESSDESGSHESSNESEQSSGSSASASDSDQPSSESSPPGETPGVRVTLQRERQRIGNLAKTNARSNAANRAEQSENQRQLFDLSGVVIANHYELLDIAGEGNVSSIYRARHLLINKIMAVKVLKSHNLRKANLVMRFQREAKLLSTLDHPNIIKFHEFGVHSTEQPYLVLEFVEGRTLEDYILCEGPLEIEQALDVILQVCDGLEYLHEREIVHRDLKPENIMLAPSEAGMPLVKLIDFGFADDHPEEDFQELTKPGSVFGTPNYMSSEQQLGFNVDHRSDIYSLVSVLFFALTGKPPFMANSTIETLQKRVNEAPPSLAEALGDNQTSRGLDEIITKGMASNPDDRYYNVEELREPLVQIYNTIHGIEEEPVKNTGAARRGSAQEVARKNVKPAAHMPILIGAVSVCILCLGASVFLLWKSQQDPSDGADDAASQNKTSVRRLESLWKKCDLQGQQQFNTGHYEEATKSFEKSLKLAKKIDPKGEMVKGSLEELIDLAVAQEKQPNPEYVKTLADIDDRNRETMVADAKVLISILDRVAKGEKFESVIEDTTSSSAGDHRLSDIARGEESSPQIDSSSARISTEKLTPLEKLCIIALSRAIKLRLAHEQELSYELAEKARLAALTLPAYNRSFMTELVYFQTAFGSSAGQGQKSSDLASISMPEIEKELKKPRKGPVTIEDGDRFVRAYLIAIKSLRFDKAHEYLAEAILLYSQVLVPDCIQVANAITYDAQLYADQGMFVEARERALEALKIYRGPAAKNRSDLYHLNELSNLYIFLGKKEMAMKTLVDALNEHQKAVLKNWGGLSDCLIQMTHIGITSHKPEGMDFLCHRSIAIVKRTHPLLKSGPARATRMLGELAKLRGRVSEAEKYFKQALEMDLAENKRLAKASAAEDYRALADLYFSFDTTNGYKKCVDSCEKQVQLLDSVYGSGTLSVVPAKTLMAKAFLRLGEYGKADALVREMETFLSKSKLVNPKDLNELLLVKADSFERQGDPSKAKELRMKAHRLR